VRLIERLIADPAFRAAFRRDPDAATRAARIRGVDPRLIAQLRELGPEALQSLDERESRSSLAGAMMAAAVEGVALHNLGQSLAQHLDHPAPASPAEPATPASYSPPDPPEPPDPAPAAPAPWTPPGAEPGTGGQVPRGGQVQQLPAIPAPAKAAPAAAPLPPPERMAPPADAPVARAASDDVPAPGGASDDDEQPDDSAGDEGQAADDSQATDDSAGDDGQVAEDGGSGDTEAQADAESDGDGGDDDEGTDDASDNEEGSSDENSSDGDDGSDNGDGDHDDSSDSSDGDSNSSDGDDSQDPGAEVDEYPGDSAPRPQIAAWMATEARKRGLPPELPVMASLVESGLKNLPGGDADSVGYFQMRAGIWNKGAYAGYPDNPDKQLDWFLDHAAAVKKQRLAAGRPVDSKHYGEWIADVERPAAQYRGRYQPMLDDARSLLEHAKGGGSNNAEDLANFDPAKHSGVQSPKEMLSVATKVDKLHLPYLWGGGHGAEPAAVGTRVDCSGYVSQILGVKPRTSGGFMSFGKAGAGKEVTLYANQEHILIQIGDRFFATSSSNPGGGPGEIPRPGAAYLSRFVKRHPAGL